MESVKDLNMDADEMLVVLSALDKVNRRIKEVAQTHKPLFGDEHFLTGKGQGNYSLYAVRREDTL